MIRAKIHLSARVERGEDQHGVRRFIRVFYTFSRIDVIFKHISEQSVAFGKHLCRGTIHDSTGRNNVECRYNIRDARKS